MIEQWEESLWKIKRLSGEKINLRRFSEADTEAVLAYGSDEETLRYIFWGGAKEPSDALDSIQGYYMKNAGAFAIALPGDDACIGCIDLRPDPANDKASFGYILDKRYWGRGYMTEALGMLLEIAFGRLVCNRVEAVHAAGNTGSGHVMRKCGMEQEGFARQEAIMQGVYYDVAHYAILREDWEKRQKL